MISIAFITCSEKVSSGEFSKRDFSLKSDDLLKWTCFASRIFIWRISIKVWIARSLVDLMGNKEVRTSSTLPAAVA